MSVYVDWNLAALSSVPDSVLCGAACPSSAGPACLTPLESHIRDFATMSTDAYDGVPVGEAEAVRLSHVKALNILDTARDARYDSITTLVAQIFSVPYVIISLQDAERNWFKSVTGLPGVVQVPRQYAMCAWTVAPTVPEVLVVMDMQKDARFKLNGLVAGPPFFRFYAGAPLVSSKSSRLGSLCLSDTNPRFFTKEDCNLLCNFTELVVREIEAENVKESLGGDARSVDAFRCGTMLVKQDEHDPHCWTIKYCNTLATDILGFETAAALLDRNLWDVFTLTKPRAGGATYRSVEDFDEVMSDLSEFDFTACSLTEDGHKIRLSVHASCGTTSLLDQHMAVIQIPVDLESEGSLKSSLWFLTISVERQRPDLGGSAGLDAPEAGHRAHKPAMLFLRLDAESGEWVVHMANKEAEELLDASESELLRAPILDVLSVRTATPPPEPFRMPSAPFTHSSDLRGLLAECHDFAVPAAARTRSGGEVLLEVDAQLGVFPGDQVGSFAARRARHEAAVDPGTDVVLWALTLTPAKAACGSEDSSEAGDAAPRSVYTRQHSHGSAGASAPEQQALFDDGVSLGSGGDLRASGALDNSDLLSIVVSRRRAHDDEDGRPSSTSSLRSFRTMHSDSLRFDHFVSHWLHGSVRRVMFPTADGVVPALLHSIRAEDDEGQAQLLCADIKHRCRDVDSSEGLGGVVLRTLAVTSSHADGARTVNVYKALDRPCLGSLRARLHGNEFKKEQTPSDIANGVVELDWAKALCAASGLAGAVASVHACGVAHGELTDLTVIMLQAPEARFGSKPVLFTAGLSDRLQPTLEDITDTHDDYVFFFAPERFTNDASEALRPASPEADVWSLGIILLLLFSFSLPVTDLCAAELLELGRAGKLAEEVLALDASPAPAEYRDLVVRCLDPVPSRRPTAADVQATVDRLLEALDESTVPAVPPPLESALEGGLVGIDGGQLRFTDAAIDSMTPLCS